MSTIPRKPLKPKKKLTAPKETVEVERYACLDKNFANYPGPLANTTGRTVYVMLAFLSQAQQQDDPTLRFATMYEVLAMLRWGDGQNDYSALVKALRWGRDNAFRFEKWYAPNAEYSPLTRAQARAEAEEMGIGPEEWYRLSNRFRRNQRRRENYTQRVFRQVWNYRRHLPGHPDGALVVRFDQALFATNRKYDPATDQWAGYWVAVNLTVMHRLRRRERMLLALSLLSHRFRPIKMLPNVLATRIGLRDTNPSRRLAKLEAAATAIGRVHGRTASFLREARGGLVSIKLGWTTTVAAMPVKRTPAGLAGVYDNMDPLARRLSLRKLSTKEKRQFWAIYRKQQEDKGSPVNTRNTGI